MNFWILTLFPKNFKDVFEQSILKRAKAQKQVVINIVNIRDFAKDKRKTVDDKPYGGGAGMLLKPDIVVAALESIPKKPYKILLSASGKKYSQKVARNLATKKEIALVCGHYEGTDARIEHFVDQTLSVGDFVLTGGEIAAMAVVDSVSRLIPGVISSSSTKEESYSHNLLEYPQYTKPPSFRSFKVPKVLLSGNHEKIKDWRRLESVKRTKRLRPDLLK